jgi:hypothetical protein
VKPTIAEQLIQARRVVSERGIDLVAARSVMRSMYPQLIDSPDDRVDLGTLAQIGIIIGLPKPHTTEAIAQHLANTSGAFPWEGPVGNGLTLDYYQGKFREMAGEIVFLGRQFGLMEVSE